MAYEEYFPECCYGANEVPQVSIFLNSITEFSCTSDQPIQNYMEG